MLLTLFLLVVFAAAAGLVWLHGLWSNCITLVNLLVAAMVATSYYEPITAQAVGQMRPYTYLLDFLLIWLLFTIVFGILRLVTDLLSRKRLRFDPHVELIGRSVTAVVIGYVVMMFTCSTLHLAPIESSPFNGAWQSAESSSFLGMSPDKQWFGFVRGQSKMGLRGGQVFDPNGQYRGKHFERRKQFESLSGFLDG
ncbi:MAG: hypothetical protein FJ297_17820 [Planctomycetes bacterium]|nr:hypothetical protein [Planctomycetota bacterium]